MCCRDAGLCFGRRRAEALVRKVTRRREPHLVVRFWFWGVPRVPSVADGLAPVARSHRRRRFFPHFRKVRGRGKLAKGPVAAPPNVRERFEARREQGLERRLADAELREQRRGDGGEAEPRATQGALGAHAEVQKCVALGQPCRRVRLERARDVTSGRDQRASERSRVLQRAVATLARRAAGRMGRVSQ